MGGQGLDDLLAVGGLSGACLFCDLPTSQKMVTSWSSRDTWNNGEWVDTLGGVGCWIMLLVCGRWYKWKKDGKNEILALMVRASRRKVAQNLSRLKTLNNL